jgi:TM2 domain-containing membrane protein YozV
MSQYPPPVPPPTQPPTPPQLGPYADAASKKLAAGLCGILIGGLGIHKFILGCTTAGVITLLITLLTCGLGGAVMGVIGIVEGIIYLTKSDEEFHRTYIAASREWF